MGDRHDSDDDGTVYLKDITVAYYVTGHGLGGAAQARHRLGSALGVSKVHNLM